MDILNWKFENIDCLNFLKNIPDNTISLVVTSPPYNIGKQYETRTSLKSYLEHMKPIIKELSRVLKDNGSICWEVGNYINRGEVFPLDIYFYPIFKDFGLKLRNRIIWHFGHGLQCEKRFSGRYETILWFTKSDNYTFNLDDVRIPSKYPGKKNYKGKNKGKLSGNPKGKNPEDVWKATVERLYDDWDMGIWDIPNVKSNHPEKTIHPCQFPIELVERCVLALTNKGDIVFDPFAGVGSTLIAALKNDRIGWGTELVSDYIEIGKERIDKLQKDILITRPIYQKIYEPTPKDKVAQYPKEWLIKRLEYLKSMSSKIGEEEATIKKQLDIR